MSLKAERGLIIRMQGGERLSLEQIQALLKASRDACFTGHNRGDIYDWAGKTLREHDYAKQGREAKGLPRSYVAKMTGQSRARATLALRTSRSCWPHVYFLRAFQGPYGTLTGQQ